MFAVLSQNMQTEGVEEDLRILPDSSKSLRRRTEPSRRAGTLER